MNSVLSRLLVFSLLLLLQNGVFAQQDCSSAITVCSNSYVQNTSYAGIGSVQDVPAGSSCLDGGEANSVWYTFAVTNAGNLEFQLNPLNSNDDYDFALYNLSNENCASIEAGINVPVSCNYSADQGATGISAGGIGNNNGSSDPNQNAPVLVSQGETYALLVSNFTASQNGYSLNFAGSASIVDNNAGALDTVLLDGVCNPTTIRLFLTQPISCGSIANDGSDMVITGPSNVNIVYASSVGCSGSMTDGIRLDLLNKIQTLGTYTITIATGSDGNTLTDACGNEVQSGLTISFEVEFIGPDVVVVNIVDESCGQSNGSALCDVTNGTAPYLYDWSPTSPTQNTPEAINLIEGTYYCTVTDANGCIERGIAQILNNTPIDVSNTTTGTVSCYGAMDGTAEVIPIGGTPPLTIEWLTNPSQTGQLITGLSGGNWHFIVTDATGCEQTGSVNVPQPAQINLPTVIVNPDCGATNGSVTVNPTGGNGGWTFSWNTNPVQTTNTLTNVSAGVYTITVQDQNGCTANKNVVLADNFAPNASIENRVPDCGQGVGQATAVPTSGTAPYAYQWNTNPPQTAATATNLFEGDYFVTITDGAGCVQIINVKIDSVPPPALSTNLTQPGCGLSNGGIEALVSDGVTPYTYAWSSSGNTTSVEAGLSAGNYTVTVTDNIGCTDTEFILLEQLSPQSEMTSNDACDGDEVSFSSTTTSGATVWSWDFGDGTNSDQEFPTHTYAIPGQYEVMLILEGGCMNDTVVQTVSIFAPPTATFIIDPEIVTTRTNAQFIYNGNGGINFFWDFGDGTISTENSPRHLFEMEGFYTIFMQTTDANGCEDTTSTTIEVLLQPVVYLPNAFMPEGTPENSRFKGYGIGIVSAELSVFDRWGTLLYFSNDVNEITLSGWDGDFKGKPASQGVYVYKIKAEFYNNSAFEKLGTVTLIR